MCDTTLKNASTNLTKIQTKEALVNPSEEQYDLLLQHLKELMDESRGETIFELGVDYANKNSSGLEYEQYSASVATLNSLAATLNANCVELKTTKGENGFTGKYLIRRELDEKDFMEVRVAVVGNVDSGKSSLIGVLTHGELDNGRGFARQRLFRHKVSSS